MTGPETVEVTMTRCPGYIRSATVFIITMFMTGTLIASIADINVHDHISYTPIMTQLPIALAATASEYLWRFANSHPLVSQKSVLARSMSASFGLVAIASLLGVCRTGLGYSPAEAARIAVAFTIGIFLIATSIVIWRSPADNYTSRDGAPVTPSR